MWRSGRPFPNHRCMLRSCWLPSLEAVEEEAKVHSLEASQLAQPFSSPNNLLLLSHDSYVNSLHKELSKHYGRTSDPTHYDKLDVKASGFM